MFDVAVIGGGPAGVQAAVSAVTEGFKTALIEPDKIGGQIFNSPHLENMVGYPYGITGASFGQSLRDQLFRLNVRVFDSIAAGIEQVDNYFEIETPGTLPRGFISARSVIIASGRRFKELSIEGWEHPEVRLGPREALEFDSHEREVVVVGGGNSSGQAVLHLGERATKVTVIAPKLNTSAFLTERINANPRIEVIEDVRLVRVDRNGEDNCTIHAGNGKTEHQIDACRVFVCAGMVPNSDFFSGRKAEDGHILTYENYMTSVEGIFAIGDVRAGAVNRVPSAIGEGSNLQPFLWDYLKGE